jgi:hypothetical protein
MGAMATDAGRKGPPGNKNKTNTNCLICGDFLWVKGAEHHFGGGVFCDRRTSGRLFPSTAAASPPQQKIDPALGVGVHVGREMKIGHSPQIQSRRQPAFQKALRVIEGIEGLFLLPGIDRDLHVRVPHIRRHIGSGDVHGSEAWIIHFEADQFG